MQAHCCWVGKGQLVFGWLKLAPEGTINERPTQFRLSDWQAYMMTLFKFEKYALIRDSTFK